METAADGNDTITWSPIRESLVRVKVLFASRTYHPAVGYGGPVTSLRKTCTMLVQAGHQVTVACSDMASPGMDAVRLPAGRFLMEGVRVVFLRTSFRYHWEGLAWGAFREIPNLVANSDVVHITGTRHYLGLVAYIAARRERIPYIVMPEGSVPPRFRNVSAKRVVDFFHTRPLLRQAYRVVATSDREADELVAWGVRRDQVLILPPHADRIELSHRSREELRAERGLPVDRPVLLWMGRIHPEKGIALLLTALRDPRLAPVHLLLAGEAEDKSLLRELRRQAAQPPLEGRVRFLGWIERQEKSEVLKLSDLFVFPSRKENFGLAAAEAVASGVPVVVTEGCGLAPIVADRAGMVARYGADSLADAIASLLGDGSLLERMRRGAEAVSAQLNWAPLVAYLERAYRSAVQDSGRNRDRTPHRRRR
jgi:glycosyltransferase involved in cell wall biosynthesis